MAPSKKVCRTDIPRRKNECLIFEREISQKLEEFRLARSKWVASMKNNDVINPSSTEGNESNIYRGRCVCLRKLKFKTGRLRDHYKTVKPLRYFTLKQKVSEVEVPKLTCQQEKRVKDYLLGIDSSEDYFEQVSKLKEQLWEEKEAEVRNKVNEKLEAQMKCGKRKRSRKAMEKLRARRQARAMVEPCRCKNGKEVTVVIKGFCLCDKGNLKKLKLGKIGDESNKVEQSEAHREEEWDPHLTDSLDIHKKQMSRKSLFPEKEEEGPSRVHRRQGKSNKNVSFSQGESKWHGAKTKDYKMEERTKSKEAEERQKEKEVEREERRRGGERRMEEEDLKKERREQMEREERRRAEEALNKERQEQMEREERMAQTKKENKSEKPEIIEKEEESGSMLTLFKNTTAKESEMALTQEQFEKLKKSSQ